MQIVRIDKKGFFAELNLGFSGLEKVKSAVDKKDWVSAQHEYAIYLRQSWFPIWLERFKPEKRSKPVDTGPFGAGHQHEDKLSFMLMAYGKWLIVDAGSYAYDASKWRRYVLSPYGHNIIFVDGKGQNRRPERSTYITREPVDYFWQTNEKYDYARASYGSEKEAFGNEKIATHVRRILFVKESEGRDFWIVADTLIPNDVPEVSVNYANCSVITRNPDGANLGIFPLFGDGLEVKIVKGQEEPYMQGWIPHSHNQRGVMPIPTTIFSIKGAGIKHLVYVFYPLPDGQIPDLIARQWNIPELSSSDGVSIKVEFSDNRKYQVFFPMDSDRHFTISGNTFQDEVMLITY